MSDANTDNEQLQSDFKSLEEKFTALNKKVTGLMTNVAQLTGTRATHRKTLEQLVVNMNQTLGDVADLKESMVVRGEEIDKLTSVMNDMLGGHPSSYEPYTSQSSARSSVVAEVFDKLNKTKI